MVSKDLAEYIERIHFGDQVSLLSPPLNQIFGYGPAHYQPVLRTGRVNRILLYPGCFNPPHLGHYELLRKAFWGSGRDMNLVAAIVVPLDDALLRAKLRGRDKSRGRDKEIVFTKSERVRLWNDNVRSDWFWIYNRSDDEWDFFQERLTQDISQDGFEISWVLACGPDYFARPWTTHGESSAPYPEHCWGCGDIIVSDVGRPADFSYDIGKPEKQLIAFRNCEAWKELELDIEALREYATETTSWLVSRIFISRPTNGRALLEKGT